MPCYNQEEEHLWFLSVTLKSIPDLFSFLYLVDEGGSITGNWMHWSCCCFFSSWECRKCYIVWNDKTAWPQLGNPDMLETALCPGWQGTTFFCPRMNSLHFSPIEPSMSLNTDSHLCICRSLSGVFVRFSSRGKMNGEEESDNLLRLNTIKRIHTHVPRGHSCICSNVTLTGRQMCDRSGCSIFGRTPFTVQLSHAEQCRTIYLMSCSSRLTPIIHLY